MSFRPISVRLPRRDKNTEAMALIVVLFILALVTITILAFFSQAMLNRNISFSSAGQARANLVALSGLNYVKNDLLEEIQDGSSQELDSSGANVPIYVPTSNTNMVPYRMTANVTSTNIPANLVKWSSGTYAQWPATGYTQAGPTRAASGNSTLNGSSVGRYVASSRWAKPEFNISSTSTNVVPDWVLITRQGPLTNTATAISTLANSSANNPNYVVGRYAYIVYDEGGLIDVAAAGYSPTTFPTSDSTGVAPTYIGQKGSQAFADLTQLGLTSAQVDSLVQWRNAATGLSITNYVSYLSTNAPVTGFLQAASGDHAFLGRQDLIQYWTTELAANTNMLQYLTTFSREKNAPSWGPEHDANDPTSSTYWNGSNTDTSFDSVTYNDTPTLSYAYHTGRDLTTSYNRFFPNVRVKTAFQRLNGDEAVVGEPLVKNRFDLSKLNWISYTGLPPAAITAQGVSSAVYYQAIYNNFGLIPNFASNGTTFLSWTYNHTSLTIPAWTPGTLAADTTKIMTLDQVASLPASLAREPDFFELLQAGILQGSLGLCSGDPTQATVNTDSAAGGEFFRAAITGTNAVAAALDVGGALYRPMNADTSTVPHVVNAQSMYQIIQIGANMIDQADSDNYPTELILNGDHFYGVENLPYISGIGDSALRVAATGPATAPAMSYDITSTTDTTLSGATQFQQYVHRWLEFALWNPHQNAANPPTVGPTNIRISVVGGQEYPYISTLGSANPQGGTDYSGRIFELPGTSVTVASTGSPSYADGPAWIGLTLNNYNNFPEPATINYTNSFTSDSADPAAQNINSPDGRVQTSAGWQRAGIYLGWSKSPDNPYKVPACVGVYPNYITSPASAPTLTTERAATLSSVIPLTIDLQYQDANSVWHTYQELRNLIYTRSGSTGDPYMEPNDTSWSEWLTVPTTPAGNTSSVVKLIYGTGIPAGFTGAILSNMDTTALTTLDPRTARLNFFTLHNGSGWGTAAGTGTDSMITSTIATVSEPSKGISTGPHFQDPVNPVTDTSWTSFAKTWIDNVSVSPMKNYDQTGTTTYYRDRDYVPRVGDAAGWTNVVLPSDATASETKAATPLTTGAQMQRPLHLDRPFRSVAELGYVFRDDPWKTLNLISANSADAGLLDIFCVGASTITSTNAAAAMPPDFVDGKMNINSAALNVIATGVTPRTSPVLQTLISQAVRDYQSPTSNSSVMATAITSSSDIANLSTNVVNYIRVNGPLTSISDLPAIFPQVPATTPPTPLYTGLKNPSEAFIRALADSSGTRTWNLMIDIIAQSGRYSSQASSLNSFTVEGEKHYWLHVAIDRFTGEIVDQQLEPVSE